VREGKNVWRRGVVSAAKKQEAREDERSGVVGVSDPGGVAVTTGDHVGTARALQPPGWQNAMKYICPILFILSSTIDNMAP